MGLRGTPLPHLFLADLGGAPPPWLRKKSAEQYLTGTPGRLLKCTPFARVTNIRKLRSLKISRPMTGICQEEGPSCQDPPSLPPSQISIYVKAASSEISLGSYIYVNLYILYVYYLCCTSHFPAHSWKMSFP